MDVQHVRGALQADGFSCGIRHSARSLDRQSHVRFDLGFDLVELRFGQIEKWPAHTASSGAIDLVPLGFLFGADGTATLNEGARSWLAASGGGLSHVSAPSCYVR